MGYPESVIDNLLLSCTMLSVSDSGADHFHHIPVIEAVLE